MRIAVLGGTGPEGLGIAARLAVAGETVIIGSRSEERATAAVRSLVAQVPNASISGATNAQAAAQGDIAFIVVPYAGLDHILETCGPALAGKIVVDTIIPLRLQNGSFEIEPVAEGSAAERLQTRLGGGRIVSAFKHQSAKDLAATEHPIAGDVLICGDDPEAKRVVGEIVWKIRDLRAIDAGDLKAARILEPMTVLLLNLNQRYKARASYRILGI
jgi:hypothetical protein